MTLPKHPSDQARATARRAAQRYRLKCREAKTEKAKRQRESEAPEAFAFYAAELAASQWKLEGPEGPDRPFWVMERPRESDDFVSMEIYPRWERKIPFRALTREDALRFAYVEMCAQANEKRAWRLARATAAKAAAPEQQ